MTEAKARKAIIKQALDIDVTVHVGKDGVDENLNAEIVQQIKKRRIVKVKVLNNAESDTNDVAEEIAAGTNAVVVDVRGGVIILSDKRYWDSQCQKKNFD